MESVMTVYHTEINRLSQDQQKVCINRVSVMTECLL